MELYDFIFTLIKLFLWIVIVSSYAGLHVSKKHFQLLYICVYIINYTCPLYDFLINWFEINLKCYFNSIYCYITDFRDLVSIETLIWNLLKLLIFDISFLNNSLLLYSFIYYVLWDGILNQYILVKYFILATLTWKKQGWNSITFQAIIISFRHNQNVGKF